MSFYVVLQPVATTITCCRWLKKTKQCAVGFDPLDFEQIITSGDVSHSLLQNKADELGCSNWSLLSEIETPSQKKVFVFGSGDQDEEYCTSAGWELSSIEDADLIVARGTFTINDGSGKVVSKKENEMEYWRVMEESLIAAAKRKIPMVSLRLIDDSASFRRIQLSSSHCVNVTNKSIDYSNTCGNINFFAIIEQYSSPQNLKPTNQFISEARHQPRQSPPRCRTASHARSHRRRLRTLPLDHSLPPHRGHDRNLLPRLRQTHRKALFGSVRHRLEGEGCLSGGYDRGCFGDGCDWRDGQRDGFRLGCEGWGS